jgi:hypothetical protein
MLQNRMEGNQITGYSGDIHEKYHLLDKSTKNDAIIYYSYKELYKKLDAVRDENAKPNFANGENTVSEPFRLAWYEEICIQSKYPILFSDQKAQIAQSLHYKFKVLYNALFNSEEEAIQDALDESKQSFQAQLRGLETHATRAAQTAEMGKFSNAQRNQAFAELALDVDELEYAQRMINKDLDLIKCKRVIYNIIETFTVDKKDFRCRKGIGKGIQELEDEVRKLVPNRKSSLRKDYNQKEEQYSKSVQALGKLYFPDFYDPKKEAFHPALQELQEASENFKNAAKELVDAAMSLLHLSEDELRQGGAKNTSTDRGGYFVDTDGNPVVTRDPPEGYRYVP